MIKEFFKEHDHLRFALQHLDIFDGGWEIRIYNTTYDFGVDPIYTYFIEDKEIVRLLIGGKIETLQEIVNTLDRHIESIEKENKND